MIGPSFYSKSTWRLAVGGWWRRRRRELAHQFVKRDQPGIQHPLAGVHLHLRDRGIRAVPAAHGRIHGRKVGEVAVGVAEEERVRQRTLGPKLHLVFDKRLP